MEQETKTLQFEPVRLEMRELVHRYIKPLQVENSEYTFPSLLMWGQGGYIHIAQEMDVLYILYTFPHLAPFMLAPLPLDPADYPRAIARAAAHLRGMGYAPSFRGIAQAWAPYFEAAGYILEEDRDNFDYVYNMEDLRTLTGKRYHGKRNHINQFLSQYTYTYEPVTPALVPECMEVYEKWLEGRDLEVFGVQGERVALEIGFAHMQELELVGGAIRMDGKLRAFSLGERISQNMAVIYFEKADADVPGLYPLINREFVAHAWTDVRYINREEDMGLEGLRRAKLSYYPAYLLKKYRARLPESPLV